MIPCWFYRSGKCGAELYPIGLADCGAHQLLMVPLRFLITVGHPYLNKPYMNCRTPPPSQSDFLGFIAYLPDGKPSNAWFNGGLKDKPSPKKSEGVPKHRHFPQRSPAPKKKSKLEAGSEP